MNDANHGPSVRGRSYLETLLDIHEQLKPRTYFEVGVQFGNTLELANCDTVAVDPAFVCSKNIIGKKPRCFLFQQTSDDFFEKFSPREVLGADIDLAFLDGMHHFEFLLRDFINTEKECSRDSIIIMHDCLPPGYKMTLRDIGEAIEPTDNNFPGWWAGDVWKMVPTLLKHRPDLSITVSDCAPTGLILVTSLDPQNTKLSKQYDSLTQAFKSNDRSEYDEYWKEVKVVPESQLDLSKRFRTFG